MEGTPSDRMLGRRCRRRWGREDPIIRIYYELARAIEEECEPPTAGLEGRTAFEMILGLYQSHRQGGARRTSLG